jgi:hypothetical protein
MKLFKNSSELFMVNFFGNRGIYLDDKFTNLCDHYQSKTLPFEDVESAVFNIFADKREALQSDINLLCYVSILVYITEMETRQFYRFLVSKLKHSGIIDYYSIKIPMMNELTTMSKVEILDQMNSLVNESFLTFAGFLTAFQIYF